MCTYTYIYIYIHIYIGLTTYVVYCILWLALAPPGEVWCFGVSGAGNFK